MDPGEGLERERLKMQVRYRKTDGSICALKVTRRLGTKVLVEGLTLNRGREQFDKAIKR